MRDALLRVSEAAELIWGDIEEEEDGTGRLLIRRLKTDPEGEGAVAFLSVPTMDSLKAIRARGPDDCRVFGLSAGCISRRIRQAAYAAGLGEGFSGHSPRVGMARDLARTGTALTRLMTAGRWRSPRMPALYTRNETVARGAVAHYYGSRSARGASSKVATMATEERAGDDLREADEDEADACSMYNTACDIDAGIYKSCHSSGGYVRMPEPQNKVNRVPPAVDVRRIRALIAQVLQGALEEFFLLPDSLPFPTVNGIPSLSPVPLT